MADIQIKLTGRELPARLPALLTTSARSGGAATDEFLPPGYLTPKSTFDVSAGMRSAGDSTVDLQRRAADTEIVVLELVDGSTFITSAARLQASLKQSRPELLGPDGEILVDRLSYEGGSSRGVLTTKVGGLVSKVFTFVVSGGGLDPIADRIKQVAEAGITWAGTQALMNAIESRLLKKPGLYRWAGYSGTAGELKDERPTAPADAAEAEKAPLLVFVHGTGSSTLGSFGDLRTSGQDVWAALEARFGQRIYAFEHKTFSESPIQNALALLDALPEGAHVSFVSHSRGGLVVDLLCLDDFDRLIPDYKFGFEGIGDPDENATTRVIKELDTAHTQHRLDLQELATLLRKKRLVIQRYVRIASPAHGTLLASGNFDLFLSGVLTLIGQVPFLFGNPYYSAFKRIVIEIAKNRTDPHLVPGIEAMLPDSPMAWLLRESAVRPDIQMAVIAGDIQGGNLLRKLGVLLTDFVFFDNVDNDLVVDTPAMLAGIATKAAARVLFDRGANVSHFRYFANHDTRAALRDWLIKDKPKELTVFRPLPERAQDLVALQRSASRDAQALDRPVVVVLPGVMGSHLRVNSRNRVWFDPIDIAAGGLEKIKWDKPNVEAEGLFAMSYGQLCGQLAKSHRVESFSYDWRQPLDVLAERLGEFLTRLMRETDKPIRLLAHSMGGLVVRACIHKRRAVMDELMRREGARFVMLGTPNQGAHSMVENLLGKGSTLRMLVRLDLKHTMEQVLEIVSGFRGALQLLPKGDFKDTFQGQDDGGGVFNYQSAQTWVEFKAKVRDLWFGNGKSGQPEQIVLDSANWLWSADGLGTPKLPTDYEKKTSYVFGVARNTPCGVRDDAGRLRMVGTTRGDGTVTWDSGRIEGIGQFFYMQAEHGDLAATAEHFPALVELLTTGTTAKLLKQPPATRDVGPAKPLLYDAGPPTVDDPDAIERTLLGGSQRQRAIPRAKRRLEVAVRACDLRFVSMPIMVGHYEQDPIAGPEGLIDSELLDGDLRERHSLGLYAGPRGTATVVLRPPNAAETARGSMSGAVVTGLGSYDVPLNMSDLVEAVRTGTLRYLLQVIDVLGKEEREIPLATLLIGYQSSANLGIDASVEALVQGVVDANASFYETTRLNIRVGRLEIVELYLDTAITAAYELRRMSAKLAERAERAGTTLVCRGELRHDESNSARQRLFDDRSMSYWPRLIVTDADRRDDLCPPECYKSLCPPAGGDGAGMVADGGDEPVDPRAPIADRLRYLYIGARARAESVAQQRQPGLVETLVRQQIRFNSYQEDIGRMLFQLMVPHDFKEAARQLDRLVLVVDSYTSNLPWELMLADDLTGRSDDKRPLAVRTAVVRQFASSTFRRRVRQVMNHTALVIGNPSVEGFGSAFPRPGGEKRADPPPLANAQSEAEATVLTLKGLGYDVTGVIGEEIRAIDVFAKLYHQPYRILHISAHGVFGVRHRDGRLRSGVVLSDGLLITAAEVAAMESVPELVFLNCCHLGTVDQPTGRGANKLAASVARELIDIGVRCVIVAGWAVDDAKAALFGQTFYQELLLRRRSFGNAVFAARKVVWGEDAHDITWGAFQAYGEPGWLAEPRGDGSGGTESDSEFVSPDELLDALARIRAAISLRNVRQTESGLVAKAEQVQQLIDKRALAAWLALPEVQSALATTWRQLGRLDKAREAFLAAIQAQGDLGRVPVKDIEQLANVEALLGDRMSKADPSGKSDVEAIRYMALAISRLKRLGEIVSGQVNGDGATPAKDKSPERNALIGSAWKRKAGVYARQLLRRVANADAAAIGLKMEEALTCSAAAYRTVESSAEDGSLDAYLALNRLALDLLTPWESAELKDAAIAMANRCRQISAQKFAASSSIWDAAMQADAVLVEKLIDGSFGAANAETRNATFDEVVKAYFDALSNLTIKPSEFESVVAQVELLRTFFDAKNVALPEAGLLRTAEQLRALIGVLQPTRARETPGGSPGGNGGPAQGKAEGKPTPGPGDTTPGASQPSTSAPARAAKSVPRPRAAKSPPAKRQGKASSKRGSEPGTT